MGFGWTSHHQGENAFFKNSFFGDIFSSPVFSFCFIIAHLHHSNPQKDWRDQLVHQDLQGLSCSSFLKLLSWRSAAIWSTKSLVCSDNHIIWSTPAKTSKTDRLRALFRLLLPFTLRHCLFSRHPIECNRMPSASSSHLPTSIKSPNQHKLLHLTLRHYSSGEFSGEEPDPDCIELFCWHIRQHHFVCNAMFWGLQSRAMKLLVPEKKSWLGSYTWMPLFLMGVEVAFMAFQLEQIISNFVNWA